MPLRATRPRPSPFSRLPPEPAPKPKRERNFLVSAALAAVFLLVVNAFWPDLIPITSAQVWESKGTVEEWFTLSWPIFVWGAGATFLIALLRHMSEEERQVHAGHLFVKGLLLSAAAGLVEEVCFRWLIFLAAIAVLPIGNWFFGGVPLLVMIGLFSLLAGSATKNGLLALFLGVAVPGFVYLVFGLPPGIPEWFHLNVWGPLADIFTGGFLHDTLFHPAGWAVGAAVIYANAFFRDGHKYQGIIGVVNSWFLGMFFFYLMLNHGLLAAILVHFAYDVVVFTTSAVVHSWRNDL